MRPSFFSNYPTIRVKQDGIAKRITNLSRYVRSSNDILLDLYEYYDYTIGGDERPDQVAFTEYGDSKFYWIILEQTILEIYGQNGHLEVWHLILI